MHSGIDEILVVVEPALAEEVVVAVGDPGVNIAYALADRASAGQAVAETLGDGPLFVHLADSLLAEPITPEAGAVYADGERVLAYTLDGPPAGALETPSGPAVAVDGAWHYDGTIDGVLEANSIALDRLKRGRIGADLSDAAVQGRVQIHPTAELKGAKLRGPIFIGPGARLTETYVGPYTSIGADVVLEGVELENSIVLPGAEIRFPGQRVEASLVGEGARIGRDYTLPSAVRFRVGPGSEIQLS